MKLGFIKKLNDDAHDPEKWTISGGTVHGFTRRKGNTLYVVFRGCEDTIDWMNNLRMRLMTIPYGNTKSKIRMHAGWVGEYKEEAREAVHFEVECFLEKAKKPVIITSGHSYGGALAIIAAADIQYNFGNRTDVRCVALCPPRVGNRAFVRSFGQRVPKHAAFYYGNDPTHHVPPSVFGYRHITGFVHFRPRRFRNIFSSFAAFLTWVCCNSEWVPLSVVMDDHEIYNLPDDYEIPF